MGQSSSDTAKDEDYGYLESSFTAYCKKVKTEKIISEETIRLIEYQLKKGNILGANSVISDALKNIDSAPINIAVTGEPGAGKSSFINALRGGGTEDKGATQVGVVETTMKRTPYKHPNTKTLTLWDLPGIGTIGFPPKDYLEKVQFQEYDFFIIVSATSFTKLELELAKAISLMEKNYYFVRTKVDVDLENQKKFKPCMFDKEKILEEMRISYVDKFSQNNMDAPQIFLISNHYLSDYDFPCLMDTLIKDLPAQKHHKFTLSMNNITEEIIDRMRKSIQKTIWLEAFKDGSLAVLPFVGFFRDDVENLKVKLNHYRVLFGVDDESLRVMSKKSQVPVQQLKKVIKSPYLLETKKEETLGEMLWGYIKKLRFATGGLHSVDFYARKTFSLHHLFLDTVTEDAKVLLREIYSRH
ncbi:interferon-inducible GTPase 1-like [Mesocricetus auratus]|uniref:Interferon-inducible GTPase 1-like n=1 Tax=Mesocricetus auratus TaxID=10036 RepID=A0A1U7QU69_MESAU|nr:interferon-inducible GTPase 1-like [Mesocricetus auratus]